MNRIIITGLLAGTGIRTTHNTNNVRYITDRNQPWYGVPGATNSLIDIPRISNTNVIYAYRPSYGDRVDAHSNRYGERYNSIAPGIQYPVQRGWEYIAANKKIPYPTYGTISSGSYYQFGEPGWKYAGRRRQDTMTQNHYWNKPMFIKSTTSKPSTTTTHRTATRRSKLFVPNVWG
ncbi:uncharacterized protein LOC129777106 isoform X2 [Toxorhynchites rutilus septentrionalis]|uniref:uncharacterized protein LOC129777106 isoform X2 n=1 Tax=Toxorhynchites rutilus septentrionalis TaxID=329112 RepID=UPI002479E582|nr:uncharacterized protein LOC129777106 isoform X2 [Toxorhynchites rutilus septentrionalis]